MFNLSRAMQAIDEVMSAQPEGLALTWNTPVQYDPTLTTELVAQYDELNARFSMVAARLDADPALAERAVLDCADQLHKLHHAEALKLYPVIACGLSPDPIARRLSLAIAPVTRTGAPCCAASTPGRAIRTRGEAVAAADAAAARRVPATQRGDHVSALQRSRRARHPTKAEVA
jgi:hypothetical protein